MTNSSQLEAEEEDSDDEDEERLRRTPKKLSVASTRLLQEVLATAGFPRHKDRPLSRSDEEWWQYRTNVPAIRNYIGITLDKKQQKYAQQRYEDFEGWRDINGTRWQDSTLYPLTVHLFCDNAANAEQWNARLKEELKCATDEEEVDEIWVLALDTMYHFSPYRWPIISHASQNMKASLMAFDLCLGDDVSRLNLHLLRVVTRLMGAPWANFITKDEYRAKLVEAGYKKDNIKLRDISEDVFNPLATFMEEQNEMLRRIGWGLGPYHVAKWMFRWWGVTGIIRGVIVVAEHPRPPKDVPAL